MNNHLNSILGSTVRGCQIDACSLNLNFGPSRLVIHNRWQLHDAEKKVLNEQELLGAVVTNIVASNGQLEIDFGKLRLSVEFSENAWPGPEAVVLYVDGVPAMVWS